MRLLLGICVALLFSAATASAQSVYLQVDANGFSGTDVSTGFNCSGMNGSYICGPMRGGGTNCSAGVMNVSTRQSNRMGPMYTLIFLRYEFRTGGKVHAGGSIYKVTGDMYAAPGTYTATLHQAGTCPSPPAAISITY